MRVDLSHVEKVIEEMELDAATRPGSAALDMGVEALGECATRLRELLSALGEVRRSKTHRSAVEAAQRALSGETPEHIWTAEELAVGERA